MSIDIAELAMLHDWVEERNGPAKFVAEIMAELARLGAEVEKSEPELRKAKETAVRFQRHFDEILYENPDVQKFAQKAIYQVQSRNRDYIDAVNFSGLAVSGPNVESKEDPYQRLQMVRFVWAWAMGDRDMMATPPELLAGELSRQFAEAARTQLLSHYQNQSLLNKKP